MEPVYLSAERRVIPVVIVVLTLLLTRSEQGVIPGGETAPSLYGPEDSVVILNATSLKQNIYASRRAWVVEFFSSWCGHCIHFAPKWKQFAVDFAGWQNVVAIGGIDCADDNNIGICREYEIMGYPSFRFFGANSPEEVKTKKDNGKEVNEFNRGLPIDRQENMSEMKRSVINSLASSLSSLFYPPDQVPTKSEADLWEFVKKTTGDSTPPTFLLVVFETDQSFVGKETILQLSKYPSVRVILFNKKNELYSKLSLDGWPAAGFIKRDHSTGSIEIGKNQNLVDFLTKAVIKANNLPEDLKVTVPSSKPYVPKVVSAADKEAGNIDEPVPSSGDVVSMEDLIHALRNSLRNEVGLLKKISGGRLQALKNYLHTLAEFFPADRREMMLFLTKLSSWILPFTEVDDNIYLDKLTELEVEFHPWDIDTSVWGNCKGSVQGRRGYTCGLWTLFHTLTVIAHEKNQNFPVLESIHGYVKEFFGCKECSDHFGKMVADEGALMITPIKDQLMWLWKAHNKVNIRLKGKLSEDPAHPKILYPSEDQCSECYASDAFDEQHVLQYLLKKYSKPERTLQPFNLAPDHVSDTRTHQQNRRGISSALFTGSDYWILCIVYLSVAILLVCGYLHFRVRRRIDLISTLLCQKATGKNNEELQDVVVKLHDL